MGTKKIISINDIYNNTDNPRHEHGKNQNDTLKKLFDSVGVVQMTNLAIDIAKNGILNNQQIVVVYSEKHKKYIVYEGNRRVAAIKLLMNPDNFDFLSAQTINKIKSLQIANKNALSKLNCYVTDKAEALFIMERMHSGEDKGRGVKSWNAREKEQFRANQRGEKQVAYYIDKYSRKYFNGFDITTILSYTTINRIFNNREIKKAIGIDLKDEKTFTKENIKTIIETSKWIKGKAEEEGQSVTRRFNKSRYIEDKVLPIIRQDAQSELNDSVQDTVETNNQSKDSNNKRRANPRFQSDKLYFTDSERNLFKKIKNETPYSKKIYQIQSELDNMYVKQNRYAVASLYRMIIEISTKYAANKYGFSLTSKNDLSGCVNKALDYFAESKKDDKAWSKKIRTFRAKIKKEKLIDTLNLYIHEDQEPDANFLLESWKTMSQYVVLCISQ